MVGEAFYFSHQCAQVDRARRYFDLQGGLSRLCERESIGDRAVAGGASRELGCILERSAGYQGFDTLMNKPKPLLEPHHVFAIGSEVEVSRLDDAGMHWTDCNLMQAFAFRRQELISFDFARGRAFAEWMTDIPEPEIEPTSVVGRLDRFQAEQVVNRAFQPDRRRVAHGDARIFVAVSDIAEDGDVTKIFSHQRHVNQRCVTP